MNQYLDVLKKYSVFTGRSTRTEFWMFVLSNLIVVCVLVAIQSILRFPFIVSIYDLLVLVPSIAVSVRRMHDTGRSGWWILINFVPLIGWIFFIVFAAEPSKIDGNLYGTVS